MTCAHVQSAQNLRCGHTRCPVATIMCMTPIRGTCLYALHTLVHMHVSSSATQLLLQVDT